MRTVVEGEHAVGGIDLHEVGIKGMVVRMEQQRGDRPGFFVGVPDAGEVHVHHGIAVHDDKALRELRHAGEHGPGGAERFLFQDVTDADAEFPTVAEMIFDEVGAVMDEEDEVGETVGAGEFHLVFQQGVAGHGDHGLGQVAEARPQPGAGPAGEDDELPGHGQALISRTISATARSTA